MPKITLEFESNTLGLPQTIHVHIPKKRLTYLKESSRNEKVLFLLHGKSGSGDTFYDYTDVVELSNKSNVVLIMPSMQNSYYTNMAYGEAYFDYLTNELPKILKALISLDLSETENYVLGYSMGGYGAIKWGLTEPELFSGIASLSGSLRTLQDTQEKIMKEQRKDLLLAFGHHVLDRPEDDIYNLAEEAQRRSVALPGIYIYCGRNDRLITVNRKFHDFLSMNQIEHNYIEDEGVHDFTDWNIQIRNYIEWIIRSRK